MRPTWPTWVLYSKIEHGRCADFLQLVQEHHNPNRPEGSDAEGGGAQGGGEGGAGAAAGRKASVRRRNSTCKDVENEAADLSLARRLSQTIRLPRPL